MSGLIMKCWFDNSSSNWQHFKRSGEVGFKQCLNSLSISANLISDFNHLIFSPRCFCNIFHLSYTAFSLTLKQGFFSNLDITSSGTKLPCSTIFLNFIASFKLDFSHSWHSCRLANFRGLFLSRSISMNSSVSFTCTKILRSLRSRFNVAGEVEIWLSWTGSCFWNATSGFSSSSLIALRKSLLAAVLALETLPKRSFVVAENSHTCLSFLSTPFS